MLTYNFSYPHQQGTSWMYHFPRGTSSGGNTLILNFSMPNPDYNDDYDSNIGTGGDTGTGGGQGNETGKGTGEEGKGTGGEAGKGTGGETGKGTGGETGKGTGGETGKGTGGETGKGTGGEAGKGTGGETDKGTGGETGKGTGGETGKGTGGETDKGTGGETGKGTGGETGKGTGGEEGKGTGGETGKGTGGETGKGTGEEGKGTGGETGKGSGEEGKGTGGETDKGTGGETGKGTGGETGKGTGETGKGTGEEGKGTSDKSVVEAGEITLNHTEVRNCGSLAGHYHKHLGHKSFNTSDIIKALHPEMYDNPEIMKNIGEGAHLRYGAVNYTLAFSSNLDYSWAAASNMWCNKCTEKPNHLACQDQSGEFKSYCSPAGYYGSAAYNKNFFTKSCPNLISESSSANVIKAKQLAPLILVNSAGQMIDKDGNNTQVYYSQLQPHLKVDGRMKDCSGNTKCKELDAIFNRVAWDTDKEVTLQTTALKGEASSYSSSNHIDTQDSPTPYTSLDVL